MPITATGIGSGLDVESLVAQLVLSEVKPKEVRLDRTEAAYQAQISAYGSIKGAMSGFQTAAQTTADPATYQAKTTSASDYTKLSTSATSSAVEGNYSLTVTRLAQTHSLATSAGYASTSAAVGTGTLTISTGTTSYTSETDTYNSFTQKTGTSAVVITIDASNNSLAGLRDAINGSTAAVTASIIYDGANYQLALAANDSGAENSIAIAVDDDDLNDTNAAGLSSFAFSSGATNLTQTAEGTDAALTINGLAVTSASNVVSGAVEGLDITLKETFSEPETITVTDNTGAIKTAIQGFVDGYNELVTVLNAQTSYNASTGRGSTLTGDSTVRSLLNTIRSYMNDQVSNAQSDYSYAAQVGFKTNTLDGKITLDSTKLDAALAADPLDIATLFGAYGRTTNPNVEFVSSTTESEVGQYSVDYTPASAASILGSALATNLNFSQNANAAATFDITVDGETASVTISSNYASDAEAAAGVQAAINAALSTKSVSVTLAGVSGDQLVIQSNTSGSSSSVVVSNLDNDAASLGLNSVTTTTGSDAAGSLGGFAATVSGTQLTGGLGTPTEGVKLNVLGGATSDLGSLYFSRGIGSKVDTLLSSLLSANGLVEARLTGLASSVKDVTASRQALSERADNLEALYRNQFNNLETLISGINETGSFLNQALSGFVAPLSFVKK